MLNLDLTDVKESTGFLIPPGTYVVRCDQAVVKDTKDGTGEYINCKFGITQGEYMGRSIFMMFNIKNRNEKAVEIGLQQLKAFLKSSGSTELHIKSVEQLEGLMAMAVVKTKTDDFGEKNVISYFKPIDPTKVESKEEIPF